MERGGQRDVTMEGVNGKWRGIRQVGEKWDVAAGRSSARGNPPVTALVFPALPGNWLKLQESCEFSTCIFKVEQFLPKISSKSSDFCIE